MNTKQLTYTIIAFLFALSANAYTFAPADTIVYKKDRKETLKGKIFDSPLVLKTSPTGLIWGGIFPFTSEYRLLGEITTSRTQSDQVGVSYLGKNLLYKIVEKAINTPTTEIYKVSGWKLQYAHKFYLLTKRMHAPTGFFFGPLIAYSYAHVSIGLSRYYTHTYYDFHNFNANMIAGVQIAKRDRISFELYIGGGYKNNTLFYHASTTRYAQLDTTDFLWTPYTTHLNAVFGLNLGYAF